MPGAGYRWNTGSTSAFIDATAAGLYILEVNLQGCVVSDSLTLTVAPLPTVNLGPDTTICNSSLPFVLDVGTSMGSSYLWQDQSTGSTFEVNGSGLYWLQVTSGSGCINRDSIVVTAVADPSFSLGNDTTICEGEQLRIGANLPNANYLWNNGSADGYIEIAESGTYILTVDRSGCIYRDTLNLTIAPIPKLQLEKDRVVCPDETIVLNATVGGNNQYRWSTGDAVAAISVKEPGSYTVTVTSEFGCVAVGRVQVSRGSLPSVELGGDTSICDGAEFMLQPIADNYDMLIWQDGTSSSDYWVRSTGSYYVAAGNQCGTVADTVEVAIVFCDIWVPDAFTPNGDGLNDIFKAVGSLGQLSEFELAVFNRWGQVVFRTQDPIVGWDGRFNGSEQPVGTYTYLLKFSFVDKPHVLKGNFHLIR